MPVDLAIKKELGRVGAETPAAHAVSSRKQLLDLFHSAAEVDALGGHDPHGQLPCHLRGAVGVEDGLARVGVDQRGDPEAIGDRRRSPQRFTVFGLGRLRGMASDETDRLILENPGGLVSCGVALNPFDLRA